MRHAFPVLAAVLLIAGQVRAADKIPPPAAGDVVLAIDFEGTDALARLPQRARRRWFGRTGGETYACSWTWSFSLS